MDASACYASDAYRVCHIKLNLKGSLYLQLSGPVGTQTQTRSDRKYYIPERARRAIIKINFVTLTY